MTDTLLENAPTPAPTRAELRAAERRPGRRRRAIICTAAGGAALLAGLSGIGAWLTAHETVEDHASVVRADIDIAVVGDRNIALPQAYPGASDSGGVTVTNTGGQPVAVALSASDVTGQSLLDMAGFSVEARWSDGSAVEIYDDLDLWDGTLRLENMLLPGESVQLLTMLIIDTDLPAAETWNAAAAAASFDLDVDGVAALGYEGWEAGFEAAP